MAIAIALPGFYGLGRSVTRMYLLIDHFSSIRSLNFLHNALSISVLLRPSFICEVVSNASLSFVNTLATFGIIYAIDPLLKNITKIVCLRCLTLDIKINRELKKR